MGFPQGGAWKKDWAMKCMGCMDREWMEVWEWMYGGKYECMYVGGRFGFWFRRPGTFHSRSRARFLSTTPTSSYRDTPYLFFSLSLSSLTASSSSSSLFLLLHLPLYSRLSLSHSLWLAAHHSLRQTLTQQCFEPLHRLQRIHPPYTIYHGTTSVQTKNSYLPHFLAIFITRYSHCPPVHHSSCWCFALAFALLDCAALCTTIARQSHHSLLERDLDCFIGLRPLI